MARRGTSLDTGNRFSSFSSQSFDDGWESFADDPDPRTRIVEDTSRSAFATNTSPDIPFTHSINPYRGCEHGCSYCLDGETLILMGDGGVRPLKDIVVGDTIIGTVRDGWHRTYVETTVLAHWSSRKEAYRVSLEDGTELIASGDHRFLTERGWKFVVGAERGKFCRPHLTVNNRLMGVDPAMRRKWSIVGTAVKSNSCLGVHAIEPLSGKQEMFDITTETGDFIANGVISHNCYARPTHEYLGFNAGIDFESVIVVKRDASRLARQAMMKPLWKPTSVSISGVTDPYQPLEKKLKITRSILETMLEFRNPVTIITKNALVCRDLDLLTELARYGCVAVMLSVTTLNRDLARRMEPRTSAPELRLRAIERLAEAGVPVGAMVAPVVPGLTEQEIPAILSAVADAGARWAGHTLLRLPLAVKPIFLDWLERETPGQSAKVRHALEEMKGKEMNRSQFRARMTGDGPRARAISDLFRMTAKRLGLNVDPWPTTTENFRRPGIGEQMGLF